MWVSAKFSPARVTRISTSPGPGSGLRQLGEPQHLRAAELGHLDRAHGPEAIARGASAASRTARPQRCSKVPAHVHHRGRIDRL